MSEKEPQEEPGISTFSQQPPPRPAPTMDKDTTPTEQPVNEDQSPINNKPQMIKFAAPEGQDEMSVVERPLVQGDRPTEEGNEHASGG